MPTENRSSNTEMVSELLPCPFCGQQDFLIERLDSDASVVICQGLTGPHEACLARGPVGVAQHEGEEQPGRDKAVELWSARAEQQQGEPAWYMTENGLSATHAKMKALSDRQGWDTSDYSVPLYTHADPGDAERLVAANTEFSRRHLAQLDEIQRLHAQLADLKRRHDGLHRDMATIAGREVPKGCTVANYAAAAIADALSASAEPEAKS